MDDIETGYAELVGSKAIDQVRRTLRKIADSVDQVSEAQPANPVDHRQVHLRFAGFRVSCVPGFGRTGYCWSVETTTSPIR